MTITAITPTITAITPTTPTTPAPIAELRYEVTESDRVLIEHALVRFALDYRYLLDMVTAATKADRAAKPSTPQTPTVDLSATR